MAHKYGAMKLDAISSLFDGFGHAVYLTDLSDYDNPSISYSYFVYPALYDGKKCYCLCRTKLAGDKGAKHRLYIHEVFQEEKIKNFTLQAAADNSHQVRGKVLYANLLWQVLQYKDNTSSAKCKKSNTDTEYIPK